MIVLSCRKNFSEGVEFGPHSYRDSQGSISNRFIRTDIGETILIHGYHTSAVGAMASFETISKNIPDCLGFLWPGGDLAIDYPLAVGRATQAGYYLRAALLEAVDMQTHSLGARVALEALKYGDGVSVRHLILSAPAVDHNCLLPGGEFAAVPRNCETVNIFCSRNDGVLAKDYPLGSFGGTALGLAGCTRDNLPANVRIFDCSRLVHEHSGYRDTPEYYDAWYSILDRSAKPGLTVL